MESKAEEVQPGEGEAEGEGEVPQEDRREDLLPQDEPGQAEEEGERVIPCDLCDSVLDMSGRRGPGWQINSESPLLLHYLTRLDL